MKKNENMFNFYSEKRKSSKGIQSNKKAVGKLYNYIMLHSVEYAVVSYCIDNLHMLSFKC